MIDSEPLLIGLVQCSACETRLAELDSCYWCPGCFQRVSGRLVDDVVLLAVKHYCAAIPRAQLRASAMRLGVPQGQLTSILDRLMVMNVTSARECTEASRRLVEGAIGDVIRILWCGDRTLVVLSGLDLA